MTGVSTIDTLRQVETPEGCAIALRVAGPVTRARAWFFDFLVRLLCWVLLGIATAFLGRFGKGFFLLGIFLLEWFYPVLFEVLRHGQTPGKRSCGLVVLRDDGRPVGWGASFIRNTVRFVDFFPFLYATGFVATLLNRDGKRLGDLAAGTLVVHADSGGKARAGQTGEIAGAGLVPEPPPFPLNIEEQQALIEYRQRQAQLTEERALELAELPVPLVAGLRPEAARRRLLAIADFLLGRR